MFIFLSGKNTHVQEPLVYEKKEIDKKKEKEHAFENEAVVTATFQIYFKSIAVNPAQRDKTGDQPSLRLLLKRS